MAVTAIAAVGGLLISGYKAYKNARDKKKAQEAAARMQQPAYKIQDEYIQNKNLATQTAAQGYTSAAKDFLTTEAQRGLGSSFTALGSGGGSTNDFSKVYGAYLRSINETAARDSQMQIENIQRLMDVNREIAGQKTMKWSLNEDRPFQTKRKELRQEAAIADANMWDGINGAVGSLSALGTAMSNANKIPRNQNTGTARSNDYLVSQAANTIQAQINTPEIQNRISPDVNTSTVPGLSNGSYMSGGGGYYPNNFTDNDWSKALALDYQ